MEELATENSAGNVDVAVQVFRMSLSCVYLWCAPKAEPARIIDLRYVFEATAASGLPARSIAVPGAYSTSFFSVPRHRRASSIVPSSGTPETNTVPSVPPISTGGERESSISSLNTGRRIYRAGVSVFRRYRGDS